METVKIMLERDRFTRWMGLEILESRAGYCKLSYVVKDEMLNGFDIVHGGVLFSASDSALAFACNSSSNVTLALEASISFIRTAKMGERLTVEAIEVNRGKTIGIYEIRTTRASGELVALFKGTSYQTAKAMS